jgi:hypothetical protein
MNRNSAAFLASHTADLLVERGLNHAFLEAVEHHRRYDLPIVTTRNDETVELAADKLGDEIARARQRIAELDAQIAAEEAPFSLNETTHES